MGKRRDTDTDDSDTKQFVCAQNGCTFEAVSTPDTCPGCGHPFVQHPEPEAASLTE